MEEEKPNEEEIESKEEDSEDNKNVIDISAFFNYQLSINSLIDTLNKSIDEILDKFSRQDQLLFTHPDMKLMLNIILESGFYDFCKYRFELLSKESVSLENGEDFVKIVNDLRGEIELLGFLLVHTRMAHRTLSFDLFLSLLNGGLYQDIINEHQAIVNKMNSQDKKVNKDNIEENINMDNKFYI